MLNSQRLLQRK